MNDKWLNLEQVAALIGRLDAVPDDDAATELLMRQIGNPLVGRALRFALKMKGVTLDDGGDTTGSEKRWNYLGERLVCGNFADCSHGITVGPIEGIIEEKARPLGARHSSSEAANGRPGGTLLRTERRERTERQLLDLDDGALVGGIQRERYVRVWGGMLLRDLNQLLADEGRALENLPAYMDLTVAGVLNTAAHGSGAGTGPLCDLVASITVVQADGKRVRAELASEPITDPKKWPGRQPKDSVLLQHDEDFLSMVVGVGCMGVVEEVVLRVVPAFLLSEVRKGSTWDEVKRELRRGAFREAPHYEVLVSPYRAPDGSVPCTILTRKRAPHVHRPLPLWRRPTTLAAEVFPGLGDVLAIAVNYMPWLGPVLVLGAVELYSRNPGAVHEGDGDGIVYGGPSHEVLDLGPTNRVKGVATEIAFATSDAGIDSLIDAIDGVIARAAAQRRFNGSFHSLPMSLRFTKASPHYLAMQHGDPASEVFCMVEMLALYDVKGSERAIDEFQRASLGVGRPHWGQRNNHMRDIARLGYPMLDAWRRVRAQRDPDNRFGNAMTDAFGLTSANPEKAEDDRKPRGRFDGRDRIRVDPSNLMREVTRFQLGCTADRFAETFLALKSRETRFGPLELVRDYGRDGEHFQVGERFEGRTRLDARLRAALARQPLPDLLRDLLDFIARGRAVDQFAEWLADLLSANYCEVTRLRPKTDAGGSPECEYVFLQGSPVGGSIRWEVVDLKTGGCRVTHTLSYWPISRFHGAAMKAFGLRLTEVVAYLEVEATAHRLNLSVVPDMEKPTDEEACRPLPPSRRLLPLDCMNVIAIKQDVRCFMVDRDAVTFARKLHEVLSTQEDFGIFKLRRPDRTSPFKVGDLFEGSFQVTPELEEEIRALRLPPNLDGVPAEVLADQVERILMTYYRRRPPTDYGQVTSLNLGSAPCSVRYDYREGTPIAGYTTFTIEDAEEGHCRVTQTFVYQEQDFLTVQAFGTLGLYLHNRVVAVELKVTADQLGARCEPVRP
ncbi:MAG: FAD-binding protein [Deltaproteobacteria bacterium]|nr:FAD-binding protein [Myxococcales bacterium]MDP3212520.1 FAD-binding protein [Deltaproteobacteria bacterium]